MKNQFIALSLGLMSLGAVAQKSELKEAEKAIKKQDFTNFAKYKPTDANSWDGMPIVPSRMKDYQLVSYYKKLDSQDITTLNLQHFNITRNEMIKRSLLDGTPNSLNDLEVGF